MLKAVKLWVQEFLYFFPEFLLIFTLGAKQRHILLKYALVKYIKIQQIQSQKNLEILHWDVSFKR